MINPEILCTNCTKPCESIYNEDGECWNTLPDVHIAHLNRLVKQTPVEKTEKEVPLTNVEI